MRVLVWQDHGCISLYNMDNPERAQEVAALVFKMAKLSLLPPPLSTSIGDILEWVDTYREDWEAFDIFEIRELEI